jgi:hypothetical protein
VLDFASSSVTASYYDGTDYAGGGGSYATKNTSGYNIQSFAGPAGEAEGWLIDQYALYPLVWTIATAHIPSPFTDGVTFDRNAGAYGYATGTLTYTVEAAGPPGHTIPLEVQAFGSASILRSDIGSGANAELEIDLDNPNNTPAENTHTFMASAADPLIANQGLSVFYVNTTYMVEADTPITVTVMANAYADAYVGSPPDPTITDVGMEAIVDPYFSIDPSFAEADLYQIALSPGVGNEPFPGLPTTVPEPSTWAMMLFGFVALGFASYRASRKSGAPAA